MFRTTVSFIIPDIELTDIDFALLRYKLAAHLVDTGLSAPSLFYAGSPDPKCLPSTNTGAASAPSTATSTATGRRL